MNESLKRLSIWYLLAPLATLFLIWPMASEFPPIRITENFNFWQVLIVMPVYLGIASAPGYVYAWSGHYDRKRLTGALRFWIDMSLAGAVLASIGGLTTILTVIVFPFDCASLAGALLISCRYWGINVKLIEDKHA